MAVSRCFDVIIAVCRVVLMFIIVVCRVVSVLLSSLEDSIEK